MDLHNTAIKKNASFIFETNVNDKPIDEVIEKIQPTVEIQPYINIVRSRDSTGAIYTTPTDKNFYLTGYSFSAAAEVATATAYTSLNFVLADGTSVSSAILLDGTDGVGALQGTNGQINETFPFRGVLLQKNSAITLTLGAGHSCVALISGYTDSDRSG